MSDRRSFLRQSCLLFPGLPVFASCAARNSGSHAMDGRFDPGVKLVRDGISFARKHKNNNVQPVVREEILDNPHAVFIIRTSINSTKDSDGKFPAEKVQFERAGFDIARRMFTVGTEKGGTTYIKPNFVGGFSADERSVNNGVSTHPWFVAGYCRALQDMGNTNIVVGANGAAKHEHFVESGIAELIDGIGVCFTEGKYEEWDDYRSGEVAWIDNPEGVVMRKVPFFKLVTEPDTTYINMAKDRIHQLAFTTLTIKNNQGIMPVGYMHICQPWKDLSKARSLQSRMEVFNPEYQREIERLYVRHAQEGYKHWDAGGYAQSYFGSGGWDSFKNGDIDPDYKIFWGEQWGQRMSDVVSNVHPAVNMVEGIVGVDGANTLHLNNFVTISRSMVACDAVTTWLMGHDPREMPYLRIANERGLGQNDIDKIDIYEITDRGIERVADYRTLPRAKMGVHIYSLKDDPLRYF